MLRYKITDDGHIEQKVLSLFKDGSSYSVVEPCGERERIYIYPFRKSITLILRWLR